MSDIPTTSTVNNLLVSTEPNGEDLDEPQKKRVKLYLASFRHTSGSGSNTSGSATSMKAISDSDKLENRLGGILCCTVCLDLPKAAVYQCTNGHLMCAGCFTHILADARIRDESATCPNCRTEINKTIATRNLAVEKAISELPSECQYCGKECSRNTLARHEDTECEERKTGCKFSRIGCPWVGPKHELLEHQGQCVHPRKTGDEIMDALNIIDAKIAEDRRFFNTVFDLLSYEKLTFIDLQLKPYRTEEFIHRLFYETSRFSAFNNQWVVKARINNNQRDPSQCSDRDMSYQLIMKTKSGLPFTLHFLILPGPFADMKLSSKVYKHEFTDQSNESIYLPLPLSGSEECNRLLSLKIINFSDKEIESDNSGILKAAQLLNLV